MQSFFKTTELSNHQVPGIWKHMLPEDFWWMNFPQETSSNCSNCPKVVTDKYRVDVRCCTYFPMIPNFQLGLALESNDHSKFINNVIKKKLVTPEGCLIPPSLWKLSVDEGEKVGFGKTEKITCFFADTEKKICNIYPFRNSVCSTFFCTSNHGEVGFDFWEKTQEFIGQIETSLVQWSLEQSGFDVPAYMQKLDNLAENIDQATTSNFQWETRIFNDLFAEWTGKESELFLSCSEVIKANKNDLFSIACQQKILQPRKYEDAKFQMLSNTEKSYLKPDEYKTGNPIPIEDLWYTLKATHKNLWQYPSDETSFQLDLSVLIQENKFSSIEEKFYKNKAFKISKFDKIKKNKDIWSSFIDKNTADILNSFQKPRQISDSLFESKIFQNIENPRQFIVEWYNQGILKEIKP